VADRYLKPCLDSSFFIAWLKGEVVKGVRRGDIGAHILSQAEADDFKIHTAAITLAEVHKLRSTPALADDEDERILAYFEHDFIIIIDVDRGIGEQANRLCRQYGILPNDGIHLACALRAGCDVLLAWDDRFVKVKHPSIRLEEPQRLGQGRMLQRNQ
jgi:predicted nucleic acid-binding protein